MSGETTEPLKNGDTLPVFPEATTARKVISYGTVRDAEDGTVLHSGRLHESQIQMLQSGNKMALGHLYLFAIRNGKIFHTRPQVVIDVITEPCDTDCAD